jgi:selenocysteine lyase/cysteine desulfurase
MKMDRKTFIRQLGAGAFAVAVGGTLRAGGTEAAPITYTGALPEFDPDHADGFWQQIRALYPLQEDPLYLNTAGLGPASQPVLDRVIGTMTQLQQHAETGHSLIEPARETLARFLGADPDEVCFVRNATEANSIIAAGLELGPGDEVIFETHAHPGGSFPWLNQAKERGIVVRLFDPDPSSQEGNLQRIRELATERTKVIQVSHITCTNGLVFPVAAIAAFARERGIWFHIDAAQSVGMVPIDVHAIGCDSFAFSGHKWLGGPRETGGLYIRGEQLDAVALTAAGAYSGGIERLPGEIDYARGAVRHEYGTRNAATIVGLAEAMRLQEQIGRERIASRGRELASGLLEGLDGMEGIAILTPRHEALRASITTIRHARANAEKFFGYLLSRHRLRCRPVTEQGLEAVRISTHIFTSTADCERVIAAVRAAARDL